MAKVPLKLQCEDCLLVFGTDIWGWKQVACPDCGSNRGSGFDADRTCPSSRTLDSEVRAPRPRHLGENPVKRLLKIFEKIALQLLENFEKLQAGLVPKKRVRPFESLP